MAYLPLANILHYKLRSILSALGIGIGICMLITLSGLARGTLNEIGDRWEAVDADLIVYPAQWEDNVVTMSGMGVRDAMKPILEQRLEQVDRIVPVFLTQVKLGGQDQTLVGVDSDQWHTLTGGRQIEPGGRLFDPDLKFTRWALTRFGESGQPDGGAEAIDPVDTQTSPATASSDPQDRLAEIAAHDGFELVIDSRLARKGNYRVGDSVKVAGWDWKIVGVVPAGAMGRVFAPRRAVQMVFGTSAIHSSTLFFVKLKDKSKLDDVAMGIRKIGYLTAVPVRQYRVMLEQKFAVMYRYIDAVNLIALLIAFLFVMVTLYMMVLQRTREIAILKSCGASNAFILKQVLDESLVLTAFGAAVGVGLSLVAAWAVDRFAPLYTVVIGWDWILIGVGAALVGAVIAALFPAWRATRVDMVEALTLE